MNTENTDKKDQFVSQCNAQSGWFDHVSSVRISGKCIFQAKQAREKKF